MNPQKLSFDNSNLQVTGKATGSGKRRVKQVLTRSYQFEPVGDLIVLVKLYMPRVVLNEIRKDEKKEVEAITKLWNEALAGPLKGYATDEGRLEYAKKYFAIVVVRERFRPYAIDGAPSAAGTPVNPGRYNVAPATSAGPVAFATDDPAVQLVNEVISNNIPAGAINNSASGIQVPSIYQITEVPLQAPGNPVPVASQAAGPAKTVLALGQAQQTRTDPGLNVVCHNCGNIHSQMTGFPIEEGTGLRGVDINNGTMMRKLMKKDWPHVVYILMGAVLTLLMMGYPKA